MLLLPDQTYEEEYLFDKQKNNPRFNESFPENFFRKRRHKLPDDVRSVTSLCEELLLQYGARRDFFCKYRNRPFGARAMQKCRSK